MHLFLLFICTLLSSSLIAGERVITLAPNLTEVVCALGACDRLVGVTNFCDYPAEVADKRKIGGYLDPDLETITALEPDLILALPEHQATIERLVKLGLRVETIKNYDFADIFTGIERVGELLDRRDAAATLVAELRRKQDALQPKIEGERTRVLLVLGHDVAVKRIKEVFIVGAKGFLNDLITLAGGANAWTAAEPYFPKLDQEGLIQLDPDIIIELAVANLTPEQKAAKREAWAALPFLRAVRDDRVHVLDGEHLLRAGPRYIDTLTELVAVLEQP